MRYARPCDVVDGAINGSAFNRKAKDVDGVSVTRFGFYSPNEVHDLNCVRTVVGSNLTLNKNGLFVRLSSDSIREASEAIGTMLNVFAYPTAGIPFDPITDVGRTEANGFANDAHAVIDGLPFAGSADGELYAELAGDLLCRLVTETYGTQLE